MMNSTPEERNCQAPIGKKEPQSSAQFYADGQKERIAARTALVEKAQEGLTTSDLNAIISEVGGKPLATPIAKVIDACNQSNESPAKKKSIEESRKLLDTFNDKLKNYPKILTYEGSVVLCVALSINEGNGINLNGLPQIDRETILSRLPSNALSKMVSFNEAYINVEFDNARDFILTYQDKDVHKDAPPVRLNFFNAVIHPQHLENNSVPVEGDDEKISLGGKLVFDKKRIQTLVGTSLHSNVGNDTIQKENERIPSFRQPVAGRNAFELRTDLIQFSMDLLLHNNKGNISPEDVVKTAKVLYTFVENRR